MVYRFTIEPKGAMGTPFRSDTLFGHACWCIRLHDGTEALAQFLDAARRGQPELVFSGGFPHGYLPRPLIPSATRLPQSLEEAKLAKKKKKAAWVRAEKVLKGNWLEDDDYAEQPKATPSKHALLKNTINRLTGSSLEKNGLFTTEDTWYTDGWRMVDIYVYTSWEKQKLDDFIQKLFSQGYGRDQTRGLGQVTLIKAPEPIQFKKTPQSSCFMALSHCLPCDSIVLEKSAYVPEPKFGKVWNGLEGTNPFKKPLLQTVPGSVFYTREDKGIYGRVIDDVRPDADGPRVMENCMTIPVFLPTEVYNGDV